MVVMAAKYEGSKNISIQMSKDVYVGMTVPKYAARQGMRACNNNNMRNPIIKEM